MNHIFPSLWFLFLFTQTRVGIEQIYKDFDGKFDSNRFSRSVIFIIQDSQRNIYTSVELVSPISKKKAWQRINSVLGICDYTVGEDSTCKNAFIVLSDQSFRRFWVAYDNQDKVRKIKIIRPKVSMHLIPPPCGY